MSNYEKMLELDPLTLEQMLKTNVAPYVFLSKYALLHFKRTKDSHTRKNGLIFTSSILSRFSIPGIAGYSGTKLHNRLFSQRMLEACEKSSSLGGLIDVMTVHPSTTTTRMTRFTVAWNSSYPEETAYGAMSDMGSLSWTGGSLYHTFQNVLMSAVDWRPINLEMGKAYAARKKAQLEKAKLEGPLSLDHKK
jgi:NAD(P)-dependent dehydrogenase (short-subunit alcohol dehydrogenase family)